MTEQTPTDTNKQTDTNFVQMDDHCDPEQEAYYTSDDNDDDRNHNPPSHQPSFSEAFCRYVPVASLTVSSLTAIVACMVLMIQEYNVGGIDYMNAAADAFTVFAVSMIVCFIGFTVCFTIVFACGYFNTSFVALGKSQGEEGAEGGYELHGNRNNRSHAQVFCRSVAVASLVIASLVAVIASLVMIVQEVNESGQELHEYENVLEDVLYIFLVALVVCILSFTTLFFFYMVCVRVEMTSCPQSCSYVDLT